MPSLSIDSCLFYAACGPNENTGRKVLPVLIKGEQNLIYRQGAKGFEAVPEGAPGNSRSRPPEVPV